MTLNQWVNEGTSGERAYRFGLLAKHLKIGIGALQRYTYRDPYDVPIKHWQGIYEATGGKVTCWDMHKGLKELIDATGKER